ncbi:MAG: LysM peptidoglycan-binding domain-containing protein [Lysinibacillus sp.]|nr:LysM peptidoglycan-binding domain-containing protein [Lysinibacillus sp.]
MLDRKKKLLVLSAGLLASTLMTQNADASTEEIVEKSKVNTIAHVNIKNKLLSKNIISDIDRSITRKETLSKARMTKLTSSNLASQISYQVVVGDNLTKISKQFNVSIEDIMKWNQLSSPDVIYAGQILHIYGPTEDYGSSRDETNFAEDADSFNEFVEEAEDYGITNQYMEDYLKKKEQEIEEQLAKEQMIATDPTLEGQAIYERALEIAREQLGVPYKYGGNTPEGFDCSGFVRYVYFNAGLNIERKSSEDYFMKDTTIIKNPVPGDVVFFKNTYKAGISHMGIYIGDGVFIHAGNDGVEMASLEMEYWKKRFVTFKRFDGISSY